VKHTHIRYLPLLVLILTIGPLAFAQAPPAPISPPGGPPPAAPVISVTSATDCSGMGPRETICAAPGGKTPISLTALLNGTVTLAAVRGFDTSPVYEINNDTGRTTFTLTFNGTLAYNQTPSCQATGAFGGNLCTIAGPLGTAVTGQSYGPPPGIMPGQFWNPNVEVTFSGIPAGNFDLTFTGFFDGDVGWFEPQCVMTTIPGTQDATWPPACPDQSVSVYPPFTGDGVNGWSVNLQNDFWNYSYAEEENPNETLAQMQTDYGTSLGTWYSTDNFPTGETAIATAPDSDVIYLSDPPAVNSFSYIYSSFADDLNANPNTDAEFAYDIWLNGYADEVMIWNDISNRGGPDYYGGCTPNLTAKDIQFGGTNGVPINDWNLSICGSEHIWELESEYLPASGTYSGGTAYGTGETVNQGNGYVYGITAGSVDIQAMLQWLMTHGTTNNGVLTPYIPTTSTLDQIEYTVEVASTGGVDENFVVSNFSLTEAPPAPSSALAFAFAPASSVAFRGNLGIITVYVPAEALLKSPSVPVTLSISGPGDYRRRRDWTIASSADVASFNLTRLAFTTPGTYTITAGSPDTASATATFSVAGLPSPPSGSPTP
jgi:hypothetical protein